LKPIVKQLFSRVILLMTLIAFCPGCFQKIVPASDDYKTSMYWSLKSAESGSVSSQKMLGAMYYLGDGVPKDLKKAYMWYKLAAVQGDPAAKKILDIITILLSEDELRDAQALFFKAAE